MSGWGTGVPNAVPLAQWVAVVAPHGGISTDGRLSPPQQDWDLSFPGSQPAVLTTRLLTNVTVVSYTYNTPSEAAIIRITT